MGKVHAPFSGTGWYKLEDLRELCGGAPLGTGDMHALVVAGVLECVAPSGIVYYSIKDRAGLEAHAEKVRNRRTR